MATSKVLTVCPNCMIELPAPPPKRCPSCFSRGGWNAYVSRVQKEWNKTRIEELPFFTPQSVWNHKVSMQKNLKGPGKEAALLDLSNSYLSYFSYLDSETKEGIMHDALAILKTLLTSADSREEIMNILKIGESIGTLANSVKKSINDGLLLNKDLLNEPRS